MIAPSVGRAIRGMRPRLVYLPPPARPPPPPPPAAGVAGVAGDAGIAGVDDDAVACCRVLPCAAVLQRCCVAQMAGMFKDHRQASDPTVLSRCSSGGGSEY